MTSLHALSAGAGRFGDELRLFGLPLIALGNTSNRVGRETLLAQIELGELAFGRQDVALAAS